MHLKNSNHSSGVPVLKGPDYGAAMDLFLLGNPWHRLKGAAHFPRRQARRRVWVQHGGVLRFRGELPALQLAIGALRALLPPLLAFKKQLFALVF